MNELREDIETVSDNVKSLVESEMKLLKLQLIDDFSIIISFIFSRFVFTIMTIVAYTMMVAAAGVYLNDALNSDWLGILAAGAISIVTVIILYLARKPLLEGPVQDFVIKHVAKKLKL